MFGRKKDAAKISDRTPVFHVRYIGHTETFVASGTGCSYGPVQRLWDNSPGEKHLRKVAVHISPTGLSLRYATNTTTTTTTTMTAVAITTTTPSRGREEEAGEHRQDFPIENISFCNADRAVNEKIFSWIVRSGDPGPDSPRKLECHAVLCSTRQKAQTMAVVLSRAFHIAYKDWRAHHRDHQPRHAAAAPGSRAGGKVASQATSKVTSKGATGSWPSGTGTGGARAAGSVARGGSSASSASSGGLGSAGSGGSGGGGGGGGVAAAAAAAAAETTLLSLAGPRSHGVTSSPTGTTSSGGSRDTSSVVGVEKSAQASNNNNNALAKTLVGNKGETHEKQQQQQQQHHLQQQQQGRKEAGEAGFWVDSILDPETEAVLRDMDGLNADFDLDDTDSN